VLEPALELELVQGRLAVAAEAGTDTAVAAEELEQVEQAPEQEQADKIVVAVHHS